MVNWISTLVILLHPKALVSKTLPRCYRSSTASKWGYKSSWPQKSKAAAYWSNLTGSKPNDYNDKSIVNIQVNIKWFPQILTVSFHRLNITRTTRTCSDNRNFHDFSSHLLPNKPCSHRQRPALMKRPELSDRWWQDVGVSSNWTREKVEKSLTFAKLDHHVM